MITGTAPQAVVVPTTPVRPPAPWQQAFLVALTVWVVAQTLHAVVAVLSGLHPGGPLPGGSIAHSWYQWDSAWFTRIAAEGYRAPGAAAFFPLFPLLMAMLDPVLPGGVFGAGLVVGSLALLAALTVLHRLVEVEADRATADRVLWYLIAFPTGFFLAAAYNTALFLALSVGAVYALRRERWWLAGVLGFLATTTRSAGLLLVVPFCYEYLRLRRAHPAVLLVPAGLAGYMTYCWQVLGDPLAFAHAQAHWGRHLDWPWSALGHQLATIARQPRLFTDTGAHNLLDLAAMLFVVAMLGYAFARLPRDQYALPLYGTALLGFMMIFPNAGGPYPLQSAARLALEVFPAFLVLARIGARPVVDRAYLILAVGAQAVLLDHFLHGGWVG